jgi:hypothetical protein
MKWIATAAVALAAMASGWARYTDPAGWWLRFPADMHLERSHATERISVWEVTVASFVPRTAVRTGSTPSGAWLRVDPPADADGRFGSDDVALRIVRQDGGPLPDLEAAESRFPLQLAGFRASDAYPPTTVRPLEHRVVADGLNYWAYVWIGPDASPERRAALARVVSSVAFPRLRSGHVVGYGFTVLQPAGHYRIGSFTRVVVQRQPFYLVRAPGGFYAVGWRWESLEGGYKSHCRLRLDARRREFFCTNMRARWDRVGRALVRPRAAARDDPLNVAVAKVAWDGHVLLQPGVARFADASYAHRLWSEWHPRR